MKAERNTVVLIVATAAAIFLLLWFAKNETNKKISADDELRRSKNFLQAVIDSTDNSHSFFNEDVQGKTIVVNVWAMWCKPCLMEIPELNELALEFRSEDILFVALNGEDELEERTKMAAQNIHFEYELLFNQEDMVDFFVRELPPYEMHGIPMNIIINRTGGIEKFFIGYSKEGLKEMHEYLRQVAGE